MDQQNSTERYPLSPMQQGMLFRTVDDQSAGFYIQQVVCTLREDLNVTALLNAWQRVVERHSILRTSILWDNKLPLQEVHHSVTLEFEEADWRPYTEEEQARKLGEYLESDRRKGFDLSVAPLMRLA